MEKILDFFFYALIGTAITKGMKYLKIENFENFLQVLGTIALGYLACEFVIYMITRVKK